MISYVCVYTAQVYFYTQEGEERTQVISTTAINLHLTFMITGDPADLCEHSETSLFIDNAVKLARGMDLIKF